MSTAFEICVPVSNIKHFGKLRKLHNVMKHFIMSNFVISLPLPVFFLAVVFGSSVRGSTNAMFSLIGHVNEYPTMHYFGNPRHTKSMIAYIILTEYFWKFQ